MPTPAERKALMFLAGVIVLGASVRVVRAARDDGSANDATRAALARQLAAVDSAFDRERAASQGGARGGARAGRGRVARRVPPRSGRDTAAVVGDERRELPASALYEPTIRGVRQSTAAQLVSPIDLDIATESDIESLPRVGPVLARRIVEDRTAYGPFGSLEEFQRVRGVGPALAAGLRGRVTFSGAARPSNAVVKSRLSTSAAPPDPARRKRRH